MNNKKRIVNLKYFREMLHICPRIPNQIFNEVPFEEEILAFLRYLGHSGEIIDVNINKLHQPWRSFAAVTNKCPSGKSTGYDNLRLSQAQILWGMYHKKNMDFSYLLWKDFVYRVEHKDAKKSNEIYYPRLTKVIINFFMTKDPSILRRNKPVELTNEDIRNSTAYKEYYAIASGAPPPKTKACVRKTQNSSDTTMPPLTATGIRLLTSAKEKQPAKSSKVKGLSVLSEVALTEAEQMKLATKRSLQQTHISQASGSGVNEGTGIIPGVADVPPYESDEEISWKSSDEDDDDDVDDQSDDDDDDQEDEDEQDDDDQDDNNDDQDSDNDGDDFVHPKLTTHDEEAKDEESFDPIVQTLSHVENSDDEGNDDASHGMNVGGDEGPDAKDDDDDMYGDLNINLEGRDVQMTDVHTTQVLEDTHVTLTLVNPDGQHQSSSVSSQFVMSMLNPSPDTCIDSLFKSTHRDLPKFGSLFGFDHHLKTLEANFSEFMQTNQFAKAVSSIPSIVDRYIDHRMNKVIIKEKVKEQVKVQVSNILPKIEMIVNEQLKAKVLTRVSNSSKTSYVVADDLFELELKKILIEKIDTVMLKRHRDDEDKDEEPSAGSDRGSKRRRAGKELESTRAPKEKASKTSRKSTEGSKSHQKTTSESAPVEEPMQTTQDLEEPSHQEFETGVADDQPIAEASQHPEWFQKQTKPPTPDRAWNKTLPATHGTFLMNRLKVDTLTPKLLAGPTYELMKGSYKSLVELEVFLEEVYKATTDQLDWNNPEGQQYPHNLLKPLPLIPNSRGRHVIPFDHFINSDLEYLRGGASSRKYTTSVTKTNAANYGHIKWIEDLFYGFAVNRESARDVYSKRRIIAVTELQIIEWHNYKHPDWITVRKDDDKLYKFKEGDFKRLRIQDIEDMLLLLVQGKLTNITVEERFASNVSLRMFTRSIVIQWRVKDLQLGVESYQKKLNLTKPDTYRSDLKRKKAYTAYSNSRGFIYQNKDKQNRLIRTDELHKFSDDTLNDVRTALDDRLRGIRMKYLPQTIWRRSDKERAVVMIQAIDKQLKTRRIMRSLEKFVGWRLYEGDFRMLQWTI
nr:hypothetical protein [Tanacetum cinerariifolium]